MKNIAIWVLRLLPAVIMLQTLYFKFSAKPESVELFTILGMEPWGRLGTGVMELIAAIMILYPKTTVYGAGLGLGLMSGAIFFHVTKLGLDFGGDYLLFTYAVICFASCAVLLLLFRSQLFLKISK